MHIGSPTGLNHRIISQQVLFTFPSTFSFFPFKDDPKIFDENNKPIDIGNKNIST